MFIVTGVSRGLGEAIAIALLEKGEKVVGIGRSHSIDHENFSFVTCDLSNLEAVSELKIEVPNGPVTLINNAGIIGAIGRMSQHEVSDLDKVLRVNTTAPMLLTKLIYQQCSNPSDFTLVNISSGAANRSIPSWAAYCASKAALNMLSETFFLEEKELGHAPKVYAVAPGVIDTDMQGEIRAADESDFSARQNFVNLKEHGDLYSSEEAAKRLVKLLDIPYAGEVFYDLRNL